MHSYFFFNIATDILRRFRCFQIYYRIDNTREVRFRENDTRRDGRVRLVWVQPKTREAGESPTPLDFIKGYSYSNVTSCKHFGLRSMIYHTHWSLTRTFSFLRKSFGTSVKRRKEASAACSNRLSRLVDGRRRRGRAPSSPVPRERTKRWSQAIRTSGPGEASTVRTRLRPGSWVPWTMDAKIKIFQAN